MLVDWHCNEAREGDYQHNILMCICCFAHSLAVMHIAFNVTYFRSTYMFRTGGLDFTYIQPLVFKIININTSGDNSQ